MMTLGMLGLSHWEILALLVIGLLLFGRRLPDVGRSVGRSIVEFKKGLKGVEEEMEAASSRPTSAAPTTGKTLPSVEGGAAFASTAAGQAGDARVSRSDVVD